MRDFTLKEYTQLLKALQDRGFLFISFKQNIQKSKDEFVVLRHDVDRIPLNSLKTARIENELGINGTYYFRIVKGNFDEKIIKQIADWGHEVGYHYENLTTCGGDFQLAIYDFRCNLKKFRKIYPVKTICGHGSPLSKYDNHLLWGKYDYRKFGIIGDPDFDLDFNEVFYITDTGRKWNNKNSIIRDKVESNFNIKIKNTDHLIQLLKNGKLPNKIMLNIHPQRWTDSLIPWTKELIWQNIKNLVKYFLVKIRKDLK